MITKVDGGWHEQFPLPILIRQGPRQHAQSYVATSISIDRYQIFDRLAYHIHRRLIAAGSSTSGGYGFEELIFEHGTTDHDLFEFYIVCINYLRADQENPNVSQRGRHTINGRRIAWATFSEENFHHILFYSSLQPDSCITYGLPGCM